MPPKIYGFKSRAKAKILSDNAHRLKSKENIEYPQPTRMLELYTFTLLATATGVAGSTTSATIKLAGQDDNEVTEDVVDELGIFGTLAIGTVGYCYRQMGKYLIIQAACEEV